MREPTRNETADHERKVERFVGQLTDHQNRMVGYVYSLVGDHSRAHDIVQETNLVLWRKLDQFDPDKPFTPWAFAIARYQVLAFLRDAKRDRLLLDAELVEQMSSVLEEQAAQTDDYRDALRECLETLTDTNRELIELRYYRNRSVKQVAESVGRSTGSVKVALLRVRRHLSDCVQRQFASDGRLATDGPLTL